jgi:hypothetical protein
VWIQEDTVWPSVLFLVALGFPKQLISSDQKIQEEEVGIV